MNVGLFIPCYVDAFFPEVGVATLELLERFGCSVGYPLEQTCCGQPMANSGCQEDAVGSIWRRVLTASSWPGLPRRAISRA
jgi:L-lactate dehydrogenase complex protein LldE